MGQHYGFDSSSSEAVLVEERRDGSQFFRRAAV